MRRFLLAAVSLLFIAIMCAAGYIGYEAYSFMKIPPQSPGEEKLFAVEPGETFYQIAQRLHDQDLITNVQYFRLLARYKKQIEAIQAGEFKLDTGWPPEKVLETLATGQPILYRLSIPEGLTWWQIAAIVEKAGYATFQDFANTIRNPALLAEYNIPFDTAEGFLFPETYMLRRAKEKNARPIVEMLLKMYWEQVAKIWPEGPPPAEDLKRIMILASLVEKESAAPEERPTIAGVYAKRLEKRMLLQADPTVIYGLGETFDGNLTRKHLNDATNPYNTYQIPGLPPGPICSPGLESIKAAVNPEDNDYLYFVAKGDGTHHFSKTLREHNNAVRKYQLRK